MLFQSTHLHEVWRSLIFGLFVWFSFNPHTYMRCDILDSHCERIRLSFNPHTYMRCDATNLNCSIGQVQFQSTHLHEVWRQHGKASRYMQSFNPHTYMRCDLYVDVSPTICSCFNPHTYMRCDFLCWFKKICIKVSIHTPTWGVTQIVEITESKVEFQSTHLHEVWHRSSIL